MGNAKIDGHNRPSIIVLSGDEDDTFRWVSDGWYAREQRGTPKAERLMRKAITAIRKGVDVRDTVRQLEASGFNVVRKIQYCDGGMCPWCGHTTPRHADWCELWKELRKSREPLT